MKLNSKCGQPSPSIWMCILVSKYTNNAQTHCHFHVIPIQVFVYVAYLMQNKWSKTKINRIKLRSVGRGVWGGGGDDDCSGNIFHLLKLYVCVCELWDMKQKLSVDLFVEPVLQRVCVYLSSGIVAFECSCSCLYDMFVAQEQRTEQHWCA